MTRRLIKSNQQSGEDFSISNAGLVTSPKPGVVYNPDEDLVFFNNVVLPQHGPRPELLDNQPVVG